MNISNPQNQTSFKRTMLLLPATLAAALLLALTNLDGTANAGVTGAIFTTVSNSVSNCQQVNGNIYMSKDDVYLDGGPSKTGAAGLPNGDYYVMITIPSTSTVLGNSFPDTVAVSGGEFATCLQLSTFVYSFSSGFTTHGYDDTLNNGGEYKVSVSTNSTFPNDLTKTDNFKVRRQATCDTCVTITCPADKEICNDQGLGCGTYNFGTPDVQGGVAPVTVCTLPDSTQITASYCFPIGETIVTCTATDSADPLNSDTCTFTVTVGACGPAGCQIVCSDINLCNDTGLCSGSTNVYLSPTIVITTSGGVCSSSTLACTTNDASGNPVSVPSTGASFPLGSTPVTCTVTDDGGVPASCMFNVVVADCEKPVVTCPAPKLGCNDPNLCTKVVTFTASATDNCDGTLTPTCTPPSGHAFPVGPPTLVTCSATDKAGNTGTCSFNVEVRDCDKPVVTCPTPAPVCNDPTLCSAVVTFSASASDNCDGTTDTVTCDPPSGHAFPVGSTTVTCSATDKALNTGTCSFSVTVNDCEKPHVICPGDKTVTGTCSAPITGPVVVTFAAATATDNCDGPLTPSCDHASGSTFPIGTTTVTCSATDNAKNTGTCSFKVTVNQTTTAGCGGLTMGYWQNKNGQAIITASGPKTGTAALTTWLIQLNPFKDLPANSAASSVATYVYNVIKLANASGTNMNAMLKAQMLATALDVYFSDTALGGNKINATKALGGVKIDLTKICKMIDSTSGTATCSGIYQNVSGAFGASTCLSVSAMLSYAASQATAATTANTLASPWYAQNKTTQGLAKDAFDAFNNGVALIGPCGP